MLCFLADNRTYKGSRKFVDGTRSSCSRHVVVVIVVIAPPPF